MAKSKSKQPAKPVGGMTVASDWPVYEVLVSRDWDRQGAIITMLIARRSPKSGKIAAALLLIDLACLGVKSAQVKLHKDVVDYSAGLRAHAMSLQPMVPVDFDLAAKIVMTALEYAGNLGFRPDPVFTQAQPLLRGADPTACTTPVPTGGPEGKPLFINGPNDDARRIVDHLARTVGAGNFHYYVEGSAEELRLPSAVDAMFDDAMR